ncbi:DUF3306 domain-containing protein [Aliiruegeria sabulilitoris]|uniref:DUF3306 domain-containing protein n=1 Tax=Aliiruegeria sabulilitoris TaxID=1510458 RepID=UPI0008347D7F|nr:DUF3306 domain-containing protein [Aliiruegeria sabulilitoris]NDR56788.1 DUF3306 domain-containing protein [Pseudoruegeria sp. M32A2M]
MTSGDFWSRRRAAVAEEAEAEQVAAQVEHAEQAQAALAERPDEEILDELGLKDPDTLEAGDDFAAFLKAAVPERLRRRALRRLWLSNPALANLDGMVDYGEDFTDAAMVVDNLQTSYQVGKGMLKHVEALAAQEDAEGTADPESLEAAPQEDVVALADVAELADTPAAEPTTSPSEIPPSETTNAMEAPEETDLGSADDAPLPRRRMRFEFT